MLQSSDMLSPNASRPLVQVATALGAVTLFFTVGAALGDIWGAVSISMIPVGVYTGFLGLQVIGRAQSNGELTLGAGILVLLAAFITANGYGAFQRSEWKRDHLVGVVRAGVDRGVMMKGMNVPLLKTLGAYYNRLPGRIPGRSGSPGKRQQVGLGDLFQKRYSGHFTRKGEMVEFVPPALKEPASEEIEFPVVYWDSAEADKERNAKGLDEPKIVLVGRSAAGNGQDPTFVGYDGREGHVQYRSVLTRKGLTYDREN
jgi:hypothetical protein